MRRSLAALAVAAAAVTLAAGCGGGGDGDDESSGGSTTTSTTTREVDVSTPEAVVAALADAGITCSNLVSEGSENMEAFGIEGTAANCSIGGETLSIAVVTSDEDLSEIHAFLTDIVGFTSDENGNRVDTFWWVESGHTMVSFEDSVADQTPRLTPIKDALGGRIESVSAVDPPA